MAHAAGLEMTECRLLEEGGRRHFMTRRFDRTAGGDKLHMQSLAALAHFDFNAAGAHSYEQAFDVMRRLELPMARDRAAVPAHDLQRGGAQSGRPREEHRLPDEQGRRVVAGAGVRRDVQLQPGRDVDRPTPDVAEREARWVRPRGLPGLRESGRLEARRAAAILDEVVAAVSKWPTFAAGAGVSPEWTDHVQASLRLAIAERAPRARRQLPRALGSTHAAPGVTAGLPSDDASSTSGSGGRGAPGERRASRDTVPPGRGRRRGGPAPAPGAG